MLHRLREVFSDYTVLLSGTVEVDETFMGGLEGNKHGSKKLNAGKGAVGKSVVIGAHERASKKVNARVIENTLQDTLHGFIVKNVEPGSTLNTDDFKGYRNLDGYHHESVELSVGECVKEQAHVNGIGSFWSMLKRDHKGTHHKTSKKYLNRNLNEFVVRHNIREEYTYKILN